MHLAAQRTNHTVNRKRACAECARARERCSRDEPCLRCSTKSLQCLYPDDGSQKTHSLDNGPLEATGNEYGQLEDPQLALQHPSILPKQEDFMTLNTMHRASFNEDDAPLRNFIHTLRSPTTTTSSFLPDPYRNTAFNPDGPSTSLSGIGGESSGFETPNPLGTDQRVPLFDPPPGSPYTLPRLHNTLGDYHANLSADPSSSFDFSPGAMSSSLSQPQAQGAFSPVNGEGSLGSPTGDLETPAAPWGPLTLADFGNRPINLKAYELIASHFNELRLEQGDAAPAASNNISESQRTAQHELFVKMYYERFERQSY
ncbi:hypothetical protein F4781DRAFT_328265 [Annulohypoxylon bovei var. microspora]|nr:hypothetical protein F4781DRAFT_328265 [Annulohypoxylon bovei var. microspora]